MRKPSGLLLGILIIYAIIIIGSIIYFVYMQSFGTQGLQFYIGGHDKVFNVFDMLIVIVIPVAIVLFIISLIAFRRRKDLKMFIISVAFFFFLVKEILFLFQNFFPQEFIFIGNAERALELLILISFMFLLYRK